LWAVRCRRDGCRHAQAGRHHRSPRVAGAAAQAAVPVTLGGETGASRVRSRQGFMPLPDRRQDMQQRPADPRAAV